MILFLIFVLLTYGYECFKPPIQSCEEAQQLIDCGIYYGRVLSNQINDIYVYLKYGESCSLDLRGGGLYSHAIAGIFQGEGKNYVSVSNGYIVPLGVSGYIGLDFRNIEKINLRDLSIYGFKSGIVTGQGVAIRGANVELNTRNVIISDNGVGIATGTGNRYLHWISENTYVMLNRIGLFANTFGGAGGFNTYICQNDWDVMLNNVIDIYSRSFRADVVDPPFYSTLFMPCILVSINSSNVTNRCSSLPKSEARALLMPNKVCIRTADTRYPIEYSVFAKDYGRYILLLNSTILESSYISGYKTGSLDISLKEGVNIVSLDTFSYSTNQCGTASNTDTDYLCIIKEPRACLNQLNSFTLNGIDGRTIRNLTIYMSSPAYLNLSLNMPPSYSCNIYIDNYLIDAFNTSTTKTYEFNREGNYMLVLECGDNNRVCEVYDINLKVERRGKNCKNDISFDLDKSSCIVTSNRNISLRASSINTTSTLNLYINGILNSSIIVNENSSITYSLLLPNASGRYFVSGEIQSLSCADSELICIDYNQPAPTCDISLVTNLPSGKIKNSTVNIGYLASSNQQIDCELKLNNTVIHSGTGLEVSYWNSYLFMPGNYTFDLVCRARLNSSCYASHNSDIIVEDAQDQCTFNNISYNLPGGKVKPGFYNISFNSDKNCLLYLNNQLISNSTNYLESRFFDVGNYVLSLACGQNECTSILSSELIVFNETNIPPETCNINLNAYLPSGTYDSPTQTLVYFDAISNSNITCSLYINNSLIYDAISKLHNYFSILNLTYGSYIFQLFCSNDQCMESRASSIHIKNQTNPPICNLTITENIPYGTYNQSFSSSILINTTASTCHLHINDYIYNFSTNLTLDINFTNNTSIFLACYDINGCTETINKNIYILPPTNISTPTNDCTSYISSNLPNNRCIITNQSNFRLRYVGYSSDPANLYIRLNDQNLVNRYLNGFISGDRLLELNLGYNYVYGKLKSDFCESSFSGCIVYQNNISDPNITQSCYVRVNSSIIKNSYKASIESNKDGYCDLYINETLFDSFTFSKNLTKTYLIPNGRYKLNLTCFADICKATDIKYVDNSVCLLNLSFNTSKDCNLGNSTRLSLTGVGDLSIYVNNSLWRFIRNFSGYFDLIFEPGIYKIKAIATSIECTKEAETCLISSSDCIDGLNITKIGEDIKIEGSIGYCILENEIINYTNTLILKTNVTKISCFDFTYCPKSFLNEYEYVILHVNNSTKNGNLYNFSFELISNRNSSCLLYVDGNLIKSYNNIASGIYNDSIYISPGLHMINIRCNIASDEKSIVVYNPTIDDITPPKIFLKSPPNNSVHSRFPSIFEFQAFDDISPYLYCTFMISGEGLREIRQIEVPNGRIYKLRYNPPESYINKKGKYYWNVSCVDLGDPIGYSDTWVFIIDNSIQDPSQDSGLSNFIYSNKTIYLANESVGIYYGTNDSAYSLVYVNNTLIVNSTLNGTYFTPLGPLNIGEYNLTIISYYNNLTVVNNSRFKVKNNQMVVDLISPPNGSIHASSPDLNYSVDTLDPRVSCYITINDLTINQTANPGINSIKPNLSNGIYYWNVSCIDSLGNQDTSDETRMFEISKPNPYLSNFIYPNKTIYLANESVGIYYGTNDSAYSLVYVNNTLIVNSTLNGTYFTPLEPLNIGEYNLTIISYYNNLTVVNNSRFKVDLLPNSIEVGIYVDPVLTITDNETSVVNITYIINSNNTYEEGVIYINDVPIIEGNLTTSKPISIPAELPSGEYNIKIFLLKSDKKDETKTTIITKRSTKAELLIYEDRKQVIATRNESLIILDNIPVTLLLSLGILGIIIYYKLSKVRIVILSKPYVGTFVKIKVIDGFGRPVSNVLVQLITPDKKILEIKSDEQGLVSFVPEIDGVYEIIPISKRVDKSRSASKFLVEKI